MISSSQNRILILEDNVNLVANLFAYLEPRGYLLDTAQDGLAGLTLAQQGSYHLLIIDLGLPTKQGIDIIQTLRTRDCHVPILILTARDELDDKVIGFRAGADDYLTKPFAFAELEVRLEALLARSRGRERKLTVDNLSFDLDTQHVWRGPRQIHLSASERRLLEVLMRASPSVVSRSELEETLWGDDPPEGDILRSRMYELRRAIDGEQENKLLHTLRCIGYRLAVQEQD